MIRRRSGPAEASGRGGPTARWLAPFAVLAAVLLVAQAGAATTTVHEDQKLLASDGNAEEGFGTAVDIENDTLVVGARGEAGSTAGAVYVYELTAGTWSEQTKLVPSDGFGGDQFGATLDLDGDTLLVGADEDDDNGASSGSAYVFERSNGTWNQTAKITPSDGASGDRFGQAVALDGDTALISAPGDENDTGSAYVYIRDGSSWFRQAKLVPSDGTDGDSFGFSVNLDAGTALIGAPETDDGATDAGSAYVFRFDGSSWSETAEIHPGVPTGDRFGHAVALDGDTAVIGAPWDDDGGTNEGSTYVFTFDGSVWSQQTKLLLETNRSSIHFGSAITFENDTALIGAPLKDITEGDAFEQDAGRAYLYERQAGNWTQRFEFWATDGQTRDFLGRSTAFDGETIVTGAPNDDDQGTEAGSAYVFEITPPPPPENLTAVPGDASGEIDLDWDPSPTNESVTYHVHRSNRSGGPYTEIANTTDTAFTDAGLVDQTYHYVVTAEDSGGQSSDPSNEASASPLPRPPESLTAAPGSASGEIDLSWDASPDDGGSFTYKVKRSTRSGGPYTQIATTSGTTYTDTGLTDQTYYYVVTAVDDEGVESDPSNEASASPPPDAPVNLEASAGSSSGEIDLSWDRSPDDGGSFTYRVYRSTSSGEPYAFVAETSQTSYTDTGLETGTTYYYVVTAVDEEDTESPFSNEASSEPAGAGEPPQSSDDAQNDAGTGSDASDDPDAPTVLSGGEVIHINGSLVAGEDPIDAYGTRISADTTRSMSFTFSSPAGMALEVQLIDPGGNVTDADRAPLAGGPVTVSVEVPQGEQLAPGVWVTVLQHGLQPDASLPAAAQAGTPPAPVPSPAAAGPTVPTSSGFVDTPSLPGDGLMPGFVPDMGTVTDYRDERQCDPRC